MKMGRYAAAFLRFRQRLAANLSCHAFSSGCSRTSMTSRPGSKRLRRLVRADNGILNGMHERGFRNAGLSGPVGGTMNAAARDRVNGHLPDCGQRLVAQARQPLRLALLVLPR